MNIFTWIVDVLKRNSVMTEDSIVNLEQQIDNTRRTQTRMSES